MSRDVFPLHSTVVTFLGRRYNVASYTARDVNELASLYAEPIVKALEKACKVKGDVPTDERTRFLSLNDLLMDTFPQSMINAIALAIGTQYLPRLTDIVPTLTGLIHRDRTRGENKDRGISQAQLALLVLTTIFNSFRTSPKIRKDLRSSFTASRWTSLLAEFLLVTLKDFAHTRAHVRVTDGQFLATAEMIYHFLMVSKPLPRFQGGDARSCLPPVLRTELETEVDLFFKRGRHVRFSGKDERCLRGFAQILQEIRVHGHSHTRIRLDAERNRSSTRWDRCWTCKEGAAIGICGRCGHAQYCGRPCQRADWAAMHRRICLASEGST